MLAFLAFGALAAEHVIAIAPFTANTSNVALVPMAAGLSDMLTTDLSEAEAVTLVERSRFDDLLAELKLQQSALIDPKSAVRVGKGLGATDVLVGGLSETGDRVRLDARVVDVQTGRVVASVEREGPIGEVFHLERQLALAVLEALDVEVTPVHRQRLGELASQQGTQGAGFDPAGAEVEIREERVATTLFASHVFVDGAHVGALRFNGKTTVRLKPGRHEFAVALEKKAKKPTYSCWGVIDVPRDGFTTSLTDLCDRLLAGPSPYGSVLPPRHGMMAFSFNDQDLIMSAGRRRVRDGDILPFPEGDLVVVAEKRYTPVVAPTPAPAGRRHPAESANTSDEVCRKSTVVPRYGKLVVTATVRQCSIQSAPLLLANGEMGGAKALTRPKP
ncbi:MAG: CsgG/HfaB family protein [Myxococcota bacterium]